MKNILIVDKAKHEAFEDFFDTNGIKNVLHLKAKSTSRNFILSLLNLSDIPKCVYFFKTTSKKLSQLELFADDNLTKNSSGLLITLKKEEKNMKTQTVRQIKKDKLIVVAIKSGFVEIVLNATKGFPLSGATILNGKGVGKTQTQFMGMDIENQREVVLIATTATIEKQIVKALKSKLKENPNVNGVLFTLPIERFVKFDKVVK